MRLAQHGRGKPHLMGAQQGSWPMVSRDCACCPWLVQGLGTEAGPLPLDLSGWMELGWGRGSMVPIRGTRGPARVGKLSVTEICPS